MKHLYKKGHKKYENSGIKKGQKHNKTLVKMELAERIGDFDGTLYELSQELLKDPKKKDFAWKELIKYRLPQKRELSGDAARPLKVEFVNIGKTNKDT